MPSASILASKQATVQALSDKLKTAASGVVVSYQGITVGDDTRFARSCARPALSTRCTKTPSPASL